MAPERLFGTHGVYRALEKARRDGLTRFLGVSGHHRPGRFLRALEEWDFDVMLNAVNLVSRHIYSFEEQVWPAAAAGDRPARDEGLRRRPQQREER